MSYVGWQPSSPFSDFPSHRALSKPCSKEELTIFTVTKENSNGSELEGFLVLILVLPFQKETLQTPPIF